VFDAEYAGQNPVTVGAYVGALVEGVTDGVMVEG